MCGLFVPLKAALVSELYLLYIPLKGLKFTVPFPPHSFTFMLDMILLQFCKNQFVHSVLSLKITQEYIFLHFSYDKLFNTKDRQL